LIAILIQRTKKNAGDTKKALNYIKWFTRTSWMNISCYDVESKKFEHEEIPHFNLEKENFLNASLKKLKTAMYDDQYSEFFTMDFYVSLIGMFEMNNSNVEVLPQPPLATLIENYYAKLNQEPPCVFGTGIFMIQSCLNHSCKPNAALMLNEEHTGTGSSIKIKATRNIKKGEEILISYIDENLQRIERQKLLKGSYQFDCNCQKCNNEKDD